MDLSLLKRLAEEQDPMQQQHLAEATHNAYFLNSNGTTKTRSSQEEARLMEAFARTTAHLLTAHVEQTRHLMALDTTSYLLTGLASMMLRIRDRIHGRAVEEREQAQAAVLATLEASGILPVLGRACTAALDQLQWHRGPALRCFSFRQHIACLMDVWSCVFRGTPDSLLYLEDGLPQAPLVLPGARLAAAALRTYLGPKAAAMGDTERPLPGYEFLMSGRMNMLTGGGLRGLDLSMGSMLTITVVARALRVADSMSICAYNAYCRSSTNLGLRVGPPDSALKQEVLECYYVLYLVAVMLVIKAKQVYDEQQGVPAAAAPRTRRSGRPSTKTTPAASAPLTVPPHHVALAEALGVGELTDDEYFKQVIGQQPLGNAYTCRFSDHPIDSVLDDPVLGLVQLIDGHVCDASDYNLRAFQMAGLGIRLTCSLSDRASQAAMLTAIELCVLVAEHKQREHIVRLAIMVCAQLVTSFINMCGPQALRDLTLHGPSWSDANALDSHPDLHDTLAPVLREALAHLVPALLPSCHDELLPSERPGVRGSPLPAMVPQLLLKLLASVDHATLRDVLQEHPAAAIRALEAALRAGWSERNVAPPLRCSLLRAVPAVVASLGLPHTDGGPPAAAAAGAAPPGISSLATAVSTNRSLLAQLHALLVSVAKYAADMNAAAISAAGSTSSAAGGGGSGAGSSDAGPSGGSGSGSDSDTTAVAAAEILSQCLSGQQGSDGLLSSLFAAMGIDPAKGMAEVDAMRAHSQGMTRAMLASHFEAAKLASADAASLRARSSPGQFRGTLAVIAATARAAAQLGAAAVLAADALAASGAAAAASSSSSATADPGAAGAFASPAAPFVSLVGRCMHLAGAALSAARVPAAGAGGLADAEFEACAAALEAMLCGVAWLQSEPAARDLLAHTGAATGPALAALQAALQQQSAALAGGVASRAAGALLCASGLAQQLQEAGLRVSAVPVEGVCNHPGCRTMAGLSELGVVKRAAGGEGAKGCGKCSGCSTGCTYCSRSCQLAHWPVHKPVCKGGKRGRRAAAAEGAPGAAAELPPAAASKQPSAGAGAAAAAAAGAGAASGPPLPDSLAAAQRLSVRELKALLQALGVPGVAGAVEKGDLVGLLAGHLDLQ